MVAEYLAAEWFSNTETLWQGILRLEAAHSLTATRIGLGAQALLGAGPAGQPVVSQR